MVLPDLEDLPASGVTSSVIQRLIEPGTHIALDSSKACYQLAHFLPPASTVTVTTYGLDVAVMLSRAGYAVRLLGGVLDRESRSIISTAPDQDTAAIDVGFFGGDGYTRTSGLMARTPQIARAASSVFARCSRTFAVLDPAAIGAFGPYIVADAGELTGLLEIAPHPHAITAD